MALRKHVDLVALNLRVPRGYEGFWEVIRSLDETGEWTVADIVARSNVETRSVSQYVQGLREAGIAVMVGEVAGGPGFPAKRYRLQQRPIIAPRVRRDGTILPEQSIEIMWRCMKMLKVFTFEDLISSFDKDVNASTCKNYMNDLCRAGVLARSIKGGPGRPTTYRLVKNVGARAPKVLLSKMVFDPNSRTIIGVAEASEARS